MSADTKATMERAIEAHISDEHGDDSIILKAYILQAAGTGLADDRDALTYCGLAGQSGLLTLGLLAYATVNAENITLGDSD